MKRQRLGSFENEWENEDHTDYRTRPKFKAYRESVRVFIESSTPVTYGNLNREFGSTHYLEEAIDGLIAAGAIRRDESNPKITRFVYSGTAIAPEAKWTIEKKKLELGNLFVRTKDEGFYRY